MNKEKNCEGFIESILDSEKEVLLDYLLSYCDNPLAIASEDLRSVVLNAGIDEYDAYTIRNIIEASFKEAIFSAGFAYSYDDSFYLPIGEIEIEAASIPSECRDDFTINRGYGYYAIDGLYVIVSRQIFDFECHLYKFHKAKERNIWRCIDYFDVWNSPDGWYVNNQCVAESDIYIDVDNCSERELYNLFCDITGCNKCLRSIDVMIDESRIEFTYTAQSVDGFYPLGAFELQLDFPA